MMQFLLDEHGLNEFVTILVVELTYPIQYLDYKKDMSKAKRMVPDGVHDHITLHIAEKNTTKEMWEAIEKLYHDQYENRKMIL